MRVVPLLSLAALLAVVSVCAGSASAQQPVVVELFTSEGCSSCPPADALLSQLSKQRNSVNGIELILLGEHVEYWNGLGWRDRFSAPAYTQRQYDYVHQLHLATAYTPQMVIDGHLQTVGGNTSTVKQLLSESARSTKPAKVTLEQTDVHTLKVQVTEATNRRLQVLLAITEDNLVTSVGGGENGGRTLKHDAVVRELQPIGTLANGAFEKTVTAHTKPASKQADLRAIVLVQDADNGAIHGAASISLQSISSAIPGR